ncbi:zinc finger protein Rlf [Corythoichthys intestinalis]|uniref:zinc finger protein Rlf n=1 Tax=Corythoichthys intestinalis TaxID=161448 RepID=UPI0025A6826C|nr:zinc finger protein Rlf [Corythoichthys intestinalis]
MAERNVETALEWSERGLDTAEDTLVAMETLLATLRAFEDGLRQQEVSVASSSDYCDNFCQALMHYAGSRNSIDHGLPLLEVYCLSINCFAAARSHLTAESDRVTLVLKRLALSCFELFLSVPENEIPYEAWVQFHQSVQIAHDTLIQYGSTDLQALLQITGEGGAWSNPVLSALLSGQPTIQQEVDQYICLEGEGFMEMRVKHLEKMGEVAKAVVLAKACTDCSAISNQATFRHTYVSLLCQLLPNEEAIMEISRQNCKDVLEITSNLDTEGEENTGFILCTTFLTQQLQQPSLDCSWELILLWSKLQKKLDSSILSLLERCLQLGAIAKTVQHLLYLIRIIQTEAGTTGTAASVELGVKALQLPQHDDMDSRIGICKIVSGLLLNDLEVRRACHLTEFLLGPNQLALNRLQELYQRPDQKYDQESGVIPNSLRCELLLVLKAHWRIDPEFWDWNTLKYHCVSLLGLKPKSEAEVKSNKPLVLQVNALTEESERNLCLNGSLYPQKQLDKKPHLVQEEAEVRRAKVCCRICERFYTEAQIIHHSKRHIVDDRHPCPICLQQFSNRKDLIPHLRHHIQSETLHSSDNGKIVDNEIEPGEITIDPSLILYYGPSRDPKVLQALVQQAKSVKDNCEDNEHVTFEYIKQHYSLQNREEYFCPGTGCSRVFKHSKYLYVHLKAEHQGDENVKHFYHMRELREKCPLCRRHFVSAYHHHNHRKSHNGMYMCVVLGCGASFGSSTELVLHKHVHGIQVNYQCELEGCFMNYSDLGQLYHHEAQHFRDAAFTCTSPLCKKFYFSKREFIEHLSTHSITFSEKDFEDQRKAKETTFKADLERTALANNSGDTEETLNREGQKTSGSAQPSVNETPKAVLTLVAMCFDGSKFTCGFEKCGMTFSRARDVQRHLKHAHPEHLKLENKDQKHDKERGPKSKKMKTEIESDIEEDEIQFFPSSSPGEDGKEWLTSSPLRASLAKNDVLREIIIGLRRLNLNSLSPQNTSTCYTIKEKQSMVLLSRTSSKSSKKNLKIDRYAESPVNEKPYTCKMGDCRFRTARSYSLLRHYVAMHGHTIEQAKGMAHIYDTSFKPFKCRLCLRSHREKKALRIHYIRMHQLSTSAADKYCLGSTQITRPTLHNLNPKMNEEELSWEDKEKNGENGLNPSTYSSSLTANVAEMKKQETDQTGDGQMEIPHERTKRLVAKSNLCYFLDKFNKPFHCVAKNCDAAFSTQGGLVRHLQLTHHYKRSQLLLEQEAQQEPDVKSESVKKSPDLTSDEPKPQFKCQFVNCNASYHLKSSLARHTRIIHSQTPGLMRCKYEGCTKVFSHSDSMKKHILFRHCNYYDSLVVRLQSTHKKSVTGCQNKVIVNHPSSVTPETPEPKQSEEKNNVNTEKQEKLTNKKKNHYKTYNFRTYEEALQMCQDRCLRVAYPCMIQNCDSVLKYMYNLNRHYKGVHQMKHEYVRVNVDKLFFTAERLEELIQRKSARPKVEEKGKPSGACKTDKRPEPAISANKLPVKAETQGKALKDPLGFPDKETVPPVEKCSERNAVMVGADEVLYGEPSTDTQAEDSVVAIPNGHKPVGKILNLEQIKPLLRPLTINLSPPCSVRLTREDGLLAASKDGAKMAEKSETLATPMRQPLKRKNEIPAQPTNGIDPQPLGSPPHSFDIATYKPVGFEVSFLQFIQDTEPEDKKSPNAKRRDSVRCGFSVKENNQLGISLTRSRRSHPTLHKSPSKTRGIPSVRNLKSILDKALAGCGDLAIKQLQYLRPVVVLGKPVCTASLPKRFPPDPKNGKLLLGSKV